MLFKDDFYIIESSRIEEDTIIFSIKLNKDHIIYKGHFPGNPITPGVVQIEIIKELSSESLKKLISLDSMGNCKFLAILNPNSDEKVDVVLKISELEDKKIKVIAQIQNNSNIYLKMNAVYTFNEIK
jgi:3-hydroxyacyl-[acyl-carrier-protein] dehydratase